MDDRSKGKGAHDVNVFEFMRMTTIEATPR